MDVRRLRILSTSLILDVRGKQASHVQANHTPKPPFPLVDPASIIAVNWCSSTVVRMYCRASWRFRHNASYKK